MEESFHRYIGLARTIHIRCIFGGEITQYMVIYGVFLRLWPIQQVQPCVKYRCLHFCFKSAWLLIYMDHIIILYKVHRSAPAALSTAILTLAQIWLKATP